MKKTVLLEMVRDENNHPEPLQRGFNTGAWKNMEDPMAIIALAEKVIPSGPRAQEIATKLQKMLPSLEMEELVHIYRWATIKYRRELMASCEQQLVAMIEGVSDETDEVPDWIITFSSIQCVQNFGEQVRYAAIEKLGTITHHVSTQLDFVGDDGP